jgi:hypothetical protein
METPVDPETAAWKSTGVSSGTLPSSPDKLNKNVVGWELEVVGNGPPAMLSPASNVPVFVQKVPPEVWSQ